MTETTEARAPSMTMAPEKVEELLKRVREATGPDRAIDAAIAVATMPTIAEPDDIRYALPTTKADQCAVGTYWIKQRSGASLRTAPAFTASLDECRSLLGEVLPGAEYVVSTLYGQAHVECPINSDHSARSTRNDGNVPLAMLEAILEALLSQQDVKETT